MYTETYVDSSPIYVNIMYLFTVKSLPYHTISFSSEFNAWIYSHTLSCNGMLHIIQAYDLKLVPIYSTSKQLQFMEYCSVSVPATEHSFLLFLNLYIRLHFSLTLVSSYTKCCPSTSGLT